MPIARPCQIKKTKTTSFGWPNTVQDVKKRKTVGPKSAKTDHTNTVKQLHDSNKACRSESKQETAANLQDWSRNRREWTNCHVHTECTIKLTCEAVASHSRTVKAQAN